MEILPLRPELPFSSSLSEGKMPSIGGNGITATMPWKYLLEVLKLESGTLI